MEKTPPCGLDGKFLTLIYVILFQFSALWFGSRYYLHMYSLLLVPELLLGAVSNHP